MNNLLRKICILSAILPIIIINCCKTPAGNDTSFVLIKTTIGDIKIKLYDATPMHKANFLKLVNSGVYDNVLFHRIIKDFMIQSGDPETRPEHSRSLPDSINTYTIPAEFNRTCYHKRGALAAARKGNEENPEMRSSGTQFYIVQGVKYSDAELDQAEHVINSNIKQAMFHKLLKHTADSLRSSGINATDAEIQEIASLRMFDFLSGDNNYIIPEDQRNVYKSIGGVPRLDGTYTVFGEVIEGLDIVDRIAAVTTDTNDRPVNDIRILNTRLIRK